MSRRSIRQGSRCLADEVIEVAITQLPPKDVAKLADWLADYQAELWDRQIEADVAAEAGRASGPTRADRGPYFWER